MTGTPEWAMAPTSTTDSAYDEAATAAATEVADVGTDAGAGVLEDDALFDMAAPPPVSLADKFLVPPFSTLDRRAGYWTERKRRWQRFGIESELGRDESLAYGTGTDSWFNDRLTSIGGGTSVFDPVLCELVYRWFSLPGDTVLDPFAGGSVRGIAASVLDRGYVGVDIREEQVAANRAQAHLGTYTRPQWVVGDATRLDDCVPDDGFDLVFTCPPYADLEVYSDLERDISTWSYDDFLEGQAAAIRGAAARLAPDRFACWVTSDIRDKRSGAYRGLVAETIRQFEAAGMALHNEAVLLDPVGNFAIRAEKPFRATRKLVRAHQVLLVFTNGLPKRSAQRLEGEA